MGEQGGKNSPRTGPFADQGHHTLTNKEAKAVRNARVAEVARCLTLGMTDRKEIAAAVGAKTGRSWAADTISRDVTYLDRRWCREAERNFSRFKIRKLKEIEHLKKQAWIAWNQSCKPTTEEITETSFDEDNLEFVSKRIRRVRHKHGDPRLLKQLHELIELECRVMGVALSKHNLVFVEKEERTSSLDPSKLTSDQRQQIATGLGAARQTQELIDSIIAGKGGVN